MGWWKVRPSFILAGLVTIVALFALSLGWILLAAVVYPPPEIPPSTLLPHLPPGVEVVSQTEGPGSGGVERGEGRPSYRALVLAVDPSGAQDAVDDIAEAFEEKGWSLHRRDSPLIDMPESASWYTSVLFEGSYTLSLQNDFQDQPDGRATILLRIEHFDS